MMGNNILLKSLDYITLLIIIFIFGYTIISYPISYNEEIYHQQQYLLIIASLPLISILSFKYLPESIFPSSLTYLTVCILIIIELLFIFKSRFYNFQNEHLTIFICLLIYFLAFSAVPIKLLKLFFYAICLIFIAEICYFFCQVVLYFNDPYREIMVRGTLQYSGVFSIYSIAHLPLMIYIIKENIPNKHIRSLLILLMYVILLLVVFFTRSRTALLTLIPIVLASNYTMLKSYGKRLTFKKKALCISIIVAALISCLYLLFKMKFLSGIGRLEMSHISLSHIDEYLLWGVGYGKLPLKYPYWQSEYFNIYKDHAPISYFLSAGKSTLIFNDFLLLFVELGSLIFILAICIFMKVIKSKSPASTIFLSKACKISLITIAFSSISSITFHIIPVMILFTLSFAALSQLNPGTQFKMPSFFERRSTLKVILVILVSGACILFAQGIQESILIWKINNQVLDYTISDQTKLKLYEDSYEELKYNGKFLTIYGQELYKKDNHSRFSIQLLERGQELFSTFELEEYLAQAFKTQQNYTKAIEKYEFLVNYVPSLFGPKIQLAKLYMIVGDINKATEISLQILKMPVKKPSKEVEDIKAEARELLAKYHHRY